MKEIYIQLLDEGTTTYRPTQAVHCGDDMFYILPTPEYDPEMETWEFPPGSTVLCERVERDDGAILIAKRVMAI